MATQSKSQLLNDVHTLLKRRYKPKPDRSAGRLSVLEAVVYGICHEDTTREQANQALSRFKDEFFDWNEVRVSPIAEIQETLADIPDPEGRAQRIRRFLRQLFERTYGFTLEALTKKPLKEALKVLHAYEAFSSDYVTATVIQQALGGHAIPVDASTRRALERLGISEPRPPCAPRRPRTRRAQEPRRRVPRAARGAGPRHLRRGDPDCPQVRAAEDLPLRPGRISPGRRPGQAGPKPAAKPVAEPPKAKASKKSAKEPAKPAAKERPAASPPPPAKKPAAKQPPPPPPSPPRASAAPASKHDPPRSRSSFFAENTRHRAVAA